MILADRQTEVREVVKTVSILYGTAILILHNELGMGRLSARWVLLLLTADNNRIRLSISEQCSDLFKRNPQEFLRQVVTADKIWIHFYTPDTKRQLKKRIFLSESAPKRTKTDSSVRNVMVSIWRKDGQSRDSNN